MIFKFKHKFCCLNKIFQIKLKLFSTESESKLVSLSKNQKFNSHSVRQEFIDFFVKKHDHKFIKSSSVLPDNDPTLLFVNAGMNQFKSIFLNKLPDNDDRIKLKRVVNSQKCIRAGGKHCDLDNVGKDLTHHTFFEMLGNWSFGDYHKKEACHMSWSLLVDVFKLNPNNLFVTYFAGDDKLEPDIETKNIWQNIGLPLSRIIPLNSNDNFWEMGFTGPCGICTEIHYLPDHHNFEENFSNHDNLMKNSFELWNIVFIQYNRNENGELQRLSSHFVDTGLGLERLLAILQGVNSTYDTDLFLPFFQEIHKSSQIKPYNGTIDDPVDIGYRILADHSRMFTIAISDGLIPKWNGAGYVLRKIIRRAALVALIDFKLRSSNELLCSLATIVSQTLGKAFPEISKNFGFVIKVLNEEIKIFEDNIRKKKLDEEKLLAKKKHEEELNAFVEILQKEFENVNIDADNFIVHKITTKGHDLKLILKVALDHFGHKPTVLFYIENDAFYCQFSVPKKFKKSVNALNWFNIVSENFNEKEMISTKRLEQLVLAKINHLDQFEDFYKLTIDASKKYFS